MTPSARTTRLAPLEVASGLVLGHDRERLPRPSGTPVEALEVSILPALRRTPCLVSFSGGRDSSAVLALAARVARREGLPLPIPATHRFPDAPATDESEWQEQVVRHLRLPDWLRLEHRDELDVLGPFARRALRRHGLLWPSNAHFHLPLLEAAAGGSLLTGIGGDELLGPTSWQRQLDLLRGRVRPARSDLLRLAYFVAPQPLRAWYVASRLPVEYGWLLPDARHELARRWGRQTASEPRRRRAHVRWRGRFRYHRVGGESLALLAADSGVQLVHPFLAPAFRAALARTPFEERTGAFRALVGDVLPDEILARRTKSSFDEAFFARHSRAFVLSWDGTGVDNFPVDPDALAAEWRSGRPDARSLLLLQAAWLARDLRDRSEQPAGGRLERAPVLRPA
ncbi:MAG TPA: asparagine synthase-related protein [Gaiellaceae bacterium]|nr:asparagine synthase-related protein [Gaiellaceae bacterium]